MLTSLKLENFKIWDTTNTIRLAPLTMFLGTNSSGKSSLIQSLLLIRQTVKGNDPNQDLNFGNSDNNDSVAMGLFKDVLCRHGSDKEATKAKQIGIEFRWSPLGEAENSQLFSARYSNGDAGSARIDYLRLGIDGKGFTASRVKQDIYRLTLGDEYKSRGLSTDFKPHKSFSFTESTIRQLGEKARQVRETGPLLLDELSRIIYLGPVRRLAQRDYTWAGNMPASIGDDGAKAIDALIASGVAIKKAKNDKPDQSTYLFLETAKWLRQMNLADNLEIKPLGNSGRYELLLINNNEKTNIKDVGVGVSQVLPVIVAALFAKEGHIVILEEPESHLHPLAQSILAELLLKVSKEKKVQFIVETHSEHLFRRMQTLIARRDADPTDCALYFIEKKENRAEIKALTVDEYGRLSDWPDNFFGDVLGETRDQAMYAIKRRKAQRENGENYVPD